MTKVQAKQNPEKERKWEGEHNCLKWCNIENIILYSQFPVVGKINDNTNKTNVPLKIGPHNIDVITIIMGSVLGDSHLEKRSNGVGTRLKFTQSNKNVEYLVWFHKYFSVRGYCSPNLPKLTKRIKKDGIYYEYNLNSYTYVSFNWIHEMFYTYDEGKKRYKKILPLNIEQYITPQALAVWFMDDGSKSNEAARIATNNFTKEEVERLCLIIGVKYGIKASVHLGGQSKGYVLYIYKGSMPKFSKIVKPFMVPSLYYKLGKY